MPSWIKRYIKFSIYSSIMIFIVMAIAGRYLDDWSNFDTDELDTFREYMEEEYPDIVLVGILNNGIYRIDVKYATQVDVDAVFTEFQKVLTNEFSNDIAEEFSDLGYEEYFIKIEFYERPLSTYHKYRIYQSYPEFTEWGIDYEPLGGDFDEVIEIHKLGY